MLSEYDKKRLENIDILYVEDNEEILEHIKIIFETLGLKKSRYALNGEEGFKLYLEQRPDVLITDIKMPKLNGIELIKKIKEVDTDTTIIITTAFAESEYLIDAINLGIDKYIVKPIQTKKLLEIILDSSKNLEEHEELDRRNKELYLKDAIISSKSEILKDISHHWRNPLNAIYLMLEEIKYIDNVNTKELKLELEAQLDKIQNEISKLSEHIDFFSKNFRLDNALKIFSINELIETVIEFQKEKLTYNNIKLSVNIDSEDKIKIYAPYKNFFYSVHQIIKNAIEELITIDSKKSIDIFVSLKNDILKIKIFNSGSPIENSLKQKIFEPYFSTKSSSSGKGLGLFISKKLLEEANASISYANEEGGVCFEIKHRLYKNRPLG